MIRQIILLALASFSLFIITSCNSKEEYKYPFLNPGLSIEERVNDLVGRMTLEEKIGQMVNQAPAIERLGITGI